VTLGGVCLEARLGGWAHSKDGSL